MGAKGGIAAGQRQNGPGAERLDGLANGRVCREAALNALHEQDFDCCVLDLRLPDMNGFELLEKVHAEPRLAAVPVVVFTGKELTADEQAQLRLMAKSTMLHGTAAAKRLQNSADNTADSYARAIKYASEQPLPKKPAKKKEA